MTRTPIRLRRYRRADVDLLATLADDKEVWRGVRDRFPHPYTRDDATAWIETHQDTDAPHHLAIEVDGELVGGVGIDPGDDVYRLTAEIGYWVARPYWGNGIGTEAVRLLTKHAFHTFPLERLEARVYAWNPASARVLEKNDYLYEGRLHHAVIKDGQIGDVLVYGRVRTP